jgi:RND family efflux transporter MFP subunit
MRILKIVLITLILSGLAIPLLSCGSESDSESLPENQVVTVQRGDLTIDITASGNLALSVMEDLAFDISGTVEEILVEEGESVEQGQVLARLDTSEWEDELKALKRQVTTKELGLLQAEINLENAELSLNKAEMADIVDDWEVDIKELQVELAKAHVEDAKQALEEAQEELAEALDASPEITAPFDGFITKINVEGGDEVMKGTVAMILADPDSFEADILVSEMDIFQVKLGGEAWVQVDAQQGMSLPAEVTHISPTATIQSGVVNYKVKVEVQSLERVMQERQEAMEKMTQGELPDGLKQAVEEGQITQEQAEEKLKQMQQGQVPTAIPEDFQLREGLTVTVSIIADEREDVLLVPNSAITTQGWENYVQVLSPDGTIEERAITTGISNWQYTEVTDGLSEGEKVVIPQGTATTTTTPEQQRPPGGMMVPRMMGK